MHRRVPRQQYQKKRPLAQIAKEECDDSTAPLDTAAAYQDPYTLDDKEDTTSNWDGTKIGREKRAIFDEMMGNFSEKVQASARRKNSDAFGSKNDRADAMDKSLERQAVDKIECTLKPFFMKHRQGVNLIEAEPLRAELCKVLARCGVKHTNLSDLFTDCAKHPSALAYLPCVSTSYIRLSVVLKVCDGVVKQFTVENGWRKESAFVHH